MSGIHLRLPPPDTIRSIPLLSIGDLEPAIQPAASADKATKEEEPMLLSILFSPIPGKLVSKIWAGAFIDMKDMLADNMALLRQLENFSADKSTSKAKLREIKTLTTWLYCFTGYMAVQTSDPHTRELLTYTHLIIREALRAGRPSLQVREEGGPLRQSAESCLLRVCL